MTYITAEKKKPPNVASTYIQKSEENRKKIPIGSLSKLAVNMNTIIVLATRSFQNYTEELVLCIFNVNNGMQTLLYVLRQIPLMYWYICIY